MLGERALERALAEERSREFALSHTRNEQDYIFGPDMGTEEICVPRVPVEAYLKLQGRFAHLFEPQPNERMLGETQAQVDKY